MDQYIMDFYKKIKYPTWLQTHRCAVSGIVHLDPSGRVPNTND